MRHDADFHRARARRSSPEQGVPFRAERSPARRRRSRGWAQDVAAMTAIGVALGLAIAMPDRVAHMLDTAAATTHRVKAEARAPVSPRASGTPMAARDFGLCFTGGGVDCGVDGDIFRIDGEKVRVADIDAPETHPPRCAREARLGNAATTRLQALLNAGPVMLVPIDRDVDRYGRKLRIVEREGRSLGDMLMREGLARERGVRREPWC